MASAAVKKAAGAVADTATTAVRKTKESAVPIVANKLSFLSKDLAYAFALGIFGAAFWKVYQVNERRKTDTFFELLEKGEITVAVEKGAS